jgi:transposase
MPCEKLAHLDKRYRERYGMSMVENLKLLKAKGMDEFLKTQAEKYTCPTCGDTVCVHDAKCYSCDYKREITTKVVKTATELSTKKRRKAILEKTFGIDKGKIKPFSEKDRGEDREL